jgi:phosphate transport system permease protein
MTTIIKKDRKIKDGFRLFLAYFSGLITIGILLSIVIYIFSSGATYLSWDLLFSDYEESLVTIKVSRENETFDDPQIEDMYFSTNYGIGLIDSETIGGEKSVEIYYIDPASPFIEAKSIKDDGSFKVIIGYRFDVLMGTGEDGSFIYSSSSDKAKVLAENIDNCETIDSLQCKYGGGGIKGSLLATLYLILTTLIFLIPLGIGAAIFLEEILKNKKIKRVLQGLIDLTSGIPSIIFGFCGAIIFIPIVSSISGVDGFSILAGALTMTIMLIPIVIKSTQEALRSVPQGVRNGSFALGASRTQTIFKVILPSASAGIMTSILLSIGRIIGESAALIFVMGTSIVDNVDMLKAATTLSLHIWSITRVENPNYGVANAISIIILLVVLFLSIAIKIVAYVSKKRKLRGV